MMADFKKSFFTFSLVAAATTAVAQSGVVNRGTQDRAAASERHNLRAELVEALSKSSSKSAQVCAAHLATPGIEFRDGVEVNVMRNGMTAAKEVNDALALRGARAMICAAAVSEMAEPLADSLKKMKPTREQARAETLKIVNSRFSAEYKKLAQANPKLVEAEFKVSEKNGGASKPFFQANEIHVRHLPRTGAEDWTPQFEVLVNGGENQVASKAGPYREVIFRGVLAYETAKPTEINLPCKSGFCKSFAALTWDNRELKIFKDGRPWYDSENLGGEVFAIELSGERTTGTMRKVER